MSNDNKYINWCQYMADPLGYGPPGIYAYDADKNLYWQDSITQMFFYIPWQRLKEINEKALAYMKDELNDDIDSISSYLRGYYEGDKEIDADIMLFPELPYCPASQRSKSSIAILYRISDIVAIRTALLYSLYGNKVDKMKLRRYALLKDIGMYANRSYDNDIGYPELADICKYVDDFLQGITLKDENVDLTFDIVKGSSVKIKLYYLETNKLQNIRGASIILDEVSSTIIPEIIAEKHIPESFICSGGGNMYFIVPKGSGQETAHIIEKTFEDYTLTAQAVAMSKTYSLRDLAEGEAYKSSASDLERAKVLRQRSKIDWRQNPAITQAIAQRATKLHILFDNYLPNATHENEADLCDHCRIRMATYKRKSGEQELLCPSCANRTAIGNEGRSSFMREYESFCSEHDIGLDRTSPPQSVDEIADKAGYIAVLYGDGNNMGSVVANINSLSMLRYFSMKTNAVTKTAAFRAVGQAIGNRSVEFISLGGDDMMMVLPGSNALDCALKLGRYFDNGFCNWSTETKNITMSIGVAISHSKTSIQQMSDISHDLLNNAKKRAHHLISAKATGTVDIAVMESFSAFSTDIQDYRENTLIKKRATSSNTNDSICYLSMRPYTWDEAEGMLKAINFLKSEPTMASIIYDMRQAITSMSMMEAQLYCDYRYYRLNSDQKKAIDEAMAVLKSIMDTTLPMWLLLIRKNGDKNDILSPFVDIVELWNYANMKEGDSNR